MSDRLQGWLTVAAIVLAVGVVGFIEEAEAREVVCMPNVEQPTPGDTTKKIPVTYHF